MERGLSLDPRDLYSGGGVASGVFRAIGIPPVSARVLPDEVLGAAAAAHHGGRTEASVVGMPVRAVHLDIRQAYVSLASLIGGSDLLLASRWQEDDATDDLGDALAEFAGAGDPVAFTVEHRLFRRWGTTPAMVSPNGACLPYRSKGAHGEYPSRFGPLESPFEVPCFALDLFASVLYGGPTPTIHRAWRVAPDGGRADGLYTVTLPGGVTFAPYDPYADLYECLAASRIAVATDPNANAVVRARREEAAKSRNVAAAYGNFARVDRKPWPKDRKDETEAEPGGKVKKKAMVEWIDPWGHRFETPPEMVREVPGPDHCPLLAGGVTAATRFVLAHIERMVTDAGGIGAQTLVDAVTIPMRCDLGSADGLG